MEGRYSDRALFPRLPGTLNLPETNSDLNTVSQLGMGGWHGQEIGKPTAEMREYVALVRAILAGEPPPAGRRWQSTFAFMGFTTCSSPCGHTLVCLPPC